MDKTLVKYTSRDNKKIKTDETNANDLLQIFNLISVITLFYKSYIIIHITDSNFL